MYEINGDFGKVRLCRSCMAKRNFHLPFTFIDGGWHCCGELYHVTRPEGFEGYQLFFSVTDGGSVRVEETLYDISAGDVVILAPGIFHEYYAKPGCWWEFYWLHMDEAGCESLKDIFIEKGPVFAAPRALKMGKLVEELFPERFMRDEMIYEVKASQIISQILHMLLEDVFGGSDTSRKNVDMVSDLLREMELNYKNPLNIAAMADRYFVSVQHMIRIFKRETGYTPYEYLKKYRLQKASELMIFSRLSVNEIALETGFSGANNFICQFKQEYGMTPGRYRELHL